MSFFEAPSAAPAGVPRDKEDESLVLGTILSGGGSKPQPISFTIRPEALKRRDDRPSCRFCFLNHCVFWPFILSPFPAATTVLGKPTNDKGIE